jgi:hypothetical protein
MDSADHKQHREDGILSDLQLLSGGEMCHLTGRKLTLSEKHRFREIPV